ncbi:MAG: pyridoxamine 5'-phosphate oxidase [Burkholderiales bacterium]
MKNLADLRKNYERAALDETSSPGNPLVLFKQWFEQAIEAQIPEPNAMTLATVGPEGRPSTRIVLVKDFNEQGLVWFTNYDSRKGKELLINPWAALQFHWVELERVVRMEGRAQKISPERSDAYFQSRPVESRLGAWASPQSQVVASRKVLEQSFAEVKAQYGDHPPRPNHWGGYQLTPETWEFWQGRPSRLHDRLYYQQKNGAWQRERLAP